ncbi:MAG TPA: penicillin-binding protein activator [Kofleriaceae bacterium]|nr:penicillin-binding protein activator [Kofleriaceae bacterium]
MRAALVALAACGATAPPPAGPAIERHDTRQAPAAIDDAHVDPDTLDDAACRAALDRLGDRAPAAAIALRAARLAHHRGDDAEARAMVARAASAADAPAAHAALAALAAELAAPPVDPAVVAVLLPLSGKYAAIGGELRAAIALAPGDGTRWLFLDTRGEPDGAAAAVELARARGAIAILGPVGTREALAAARAASLRQIPIALLAPADGADPDAGVFRLVDSPGDEGRAVARVAASDGFPTVAVLAPRDDVGSEAADAFAAEAARLGLQVTARGTYDPTGGTLEPDVKDFLDLVPARNPRLAEHLARHPKKGWQTFEPDVAFSLLYIPDRGDRAALVAAYLPYFNVELRTTDFPDPAMLARKHGGRMPQVVQLIGGPGWHEPDFAIRGGTPVQGALIVDPCAPETGGDVAGQLAADYQARTGRLPSPPAAEAYDAALLVQRARAAAAGSPDPRGAMRLALAHARLDDGACGPATIDPAGELAHEPSVLQVSGDELIVAP